MKKSFTAPYSLCLGALLILSGYASAAVGAVETPPWNSLDRYNVVWDRPSKDSSGSMPLGNGELGLNVWVEESGDLVFYISKSDAWCENARLLKLGRVRIKLSPPLWQPNTPFRQELRLRSGEIIVQAGERSKVATLRVRVDANRPAICVDMESDSPRDVQADLEIWRTQRREITGAERHAAYGLHLSPTPVFADPDTVAEAPGDRLLWYHRNTRSIWKENLQLQDLGPWAEKSPDPLLNRTFGAVMFGEELQRQSPTSLKTVQPRRHCRITIVPATSQTVSPESWIELLEKQVQGVKAEDPLQGYENHCRWWQEFWNRSWIFIRGDADAEAVARGYILQRFMNACAGRGQMPIKFNGSLFTVDAVRQGQRFDADYRRWGGPYWFQNTRLPYWSMLAAGDFDLMQPLFRMYRDSLPLAQERTRIYYDHQGAFWPETMYFWGTYTSSNYGYNRRNKPLGLVENQCIRYHWENGLELTAMMLDYYAYTREAAFVCRTLRPLAEPIVTFYDRHYPRDARGRLRLEPAQALETYRNSVNPMPEIAGLKWVLEGLLALPQGFITATQRAQWQRLLAELPPLPMREAHGRQLLGFADKPGPKGNRENPELYAVFPFRLYGVGKPDLDLARRSFAARLHPATGGWDQSAIQAALLGLADDAARMVTANFTTKHTQSRFPAFWGPNSDWIPDQDHGCVAMIALQRMLLQTNGQKIYLLPAWPKKWDVEFQLCGPNRTTVHGVYRSGKLERYEIRPAGKKLQVVLP